MALAPSPLYVKSTELLWRCNAYNAGSHGSFVLLTLKWLRENVSSQSRTDALKQRKTASDASSKLLVVFCHRQNLCLVRSIHATKNKPIKHVK